MLKTIVASGDPQTADLPGGETVVSPGSRSARYQYYPYIDGLRAVAVLSVLVHHLHRPLLPGGFVGVDVFFVISGFIVSSSIAHFEGKGFWPFLAFFYSRRITRIFPALVVCLLITSLATALFVPNAWLSNANQKTGLDAFFGLSNFALVKYGNSYFAPITDFNPFTHTWSLAVEEQFYLVFPFLFIAWLKGGRGRLGSMALLAAAFVASLGWAAWQTGHDAVKAYYLIPSRFWELAAGVLLFQFIDSRSNAQGRTGWRLPLGILCLALLVFGLIWTPQTPFPFPWGIPAVLGTVGVIACLHHHLEIRPLHRLLGHRYLVFVGRISFSLYLWHWPVFVLFRWTYGLETLPLKALAVGLAFLLAIASWRWVEQPFRAGFKLRQYHPALVVGCGLLAIVAAHQGASAIWSHSETISLSTVNRNAALWYPNQSGPDSIQPGCVAEVGLIPVGSEHIWTYTPKGCAEPPGHTGAVVYAIGDSHAVGYDELFKLYVKQHTTPIYSYNIGCAFLGLKTPQPAPQCRDVTATALQDLLRRIRPGDVLFMPSLRLPRLSGQWDTFDEAELRVAANSRSAISARKQAVTSAVKILTEFSKRGVHIVFEAPKPVFKAPPFRCADWFNRSNQICQNGLTVSRALLDYYRQPVIEAMTEIAQRVPGVTIWDPYPVLCPDEACDSWHDGKPLFFDGDHLSSYGNAFLLPAFTKAIDARLSGAQ